MTAESVSLTPGDRDVDGVSDIDRERLLAVINARDQKGAEERRRLLAKHPKLAAAIGDLARYTEERLLKTWGTSTLEDAVRHRCEELRRDLRYQEASGLERLLIDRIVAAWIHLQGVEHAKARKWGEDRVPLVQLTFYGREASRASADFMRAVEALARVRKLLRPTVAQVNIAATGGQQVNMAGLAEGTGGGA